MIDKATIQRIKDAADIVEVVSDYVHLTRRGANYMGLCPFHNERTPSFSVNKRRNFCYCFSCHKGGSPVNFIMEKEGVSYHDALKHLAKKYGIKVEERELTDEERKLATEREGLMVAAEWAMKQMEHDLTETTEGRDIGLTYLYSRGVTEEAIKKFHLGYAIDNGQHLTPMMRNAGFEVDILRSLGITGQSQQGNLYDKYRGRVIFPIMNSSGKVVGFGGRDLKGGPAKYINSPESVLYHKNNELYGIYQAKSEIVRQDKCFLVEGYLDVISMWQSGMQNTVASSGTALTDGQIAIIHRFTNNITLLYDGDAAGIKAALRGINMLLSHKMNVTVLLLPDGDDPDSFARKHTPEEFRDYVKAHETDIIRFKIQVLMADAGDNPQQRAQAINSVVGSIACIPDDVERTVYVGECARMLKIDEATVASAVRKARFEIVEQQKKDRARRQIEADYPLGPSESHIQSHIKSQGQSQASTPAAAQMPPADQAAQSVNPDASANSNSAASAGGYINPAALNPDSRNVAGIRGASAPKQYPLLAVEKHMLKNLVKYGYLPFQLNSEEDAPENAEQAQNEIDPSAAENELYFVVDFIRDELEADAVAFSVPEFSRVYECLLENVDQYVADMQNFKLRVAEQVDKMRREGRDKIAVDCQSMSDIERAERKLEESLNVWQDNEMREFSKNYPGDFLASHENSDIRRLANEFLNERHVLSNLFAKNMHVSDDELLYQNIVRPLTEWKSEILNEHLSALMETFRREGGKDPEKDQQMQQQMLNLMTMRSQVAKNIGDRIISPRNILK